MCETPDKRIGRPCNPPIKASQLQGSKYLGNILDLLRKLRSNHDCPNRELHYDEYVAYLLLYLFCPVLTSLRALQQVSTLEEVQKRFGFRRFSLGSFSESGAVFDPGELKPIIDELVGRISERTSDAQLATLKVEPVAVDGTLLQAMPKMVWALWVDEEHRAAKMHLQFSLLTGIPTNATLTSGQVDERTVLKGSLSSGKLYVLDRGYAGYALMEAILQAHSSFLVRLTNNAVYEILEKRPISPAAAKAGVERDLIVKLGAVDTPDLHHRRLRLIQVHTHTAGRPRLRVSSKKTFRTESTEHTLLLVTDLLDLEADVVAQMYSRRWEIEIFFRWFKKILEADYLISLNKNGLTIVMYCALIASLLVTLWTGRKPTKRTYEMICFYFLGWASEAEVERHILSLARVTA